MRRLIAFAFLLLMVGVTRQAIAQEKLPERIKDELAGEFRLIPKGEFLMGATEGEEGSKPNERPRHKVTIAKPYYMAAHEVTVAQFRRFVGVTGHISQSETNDTGGAGYDKNIRMFARVPSKGLLRPNYLQRFTWKFPGFGQKDDHPVVNVGWKDAIAYCRWLTDKDGKHFYRLPTEAEWEYACRAGSETAYHWGKKSRSMILKENIADKTLKKKLSYKDRSFKGCAVWIDHHPFTSPVGKFKPNVFGLYDMHGNVKEWCQDLYDDTRYEKPTSFVPVEGDYRVLRGGSFQGSAARARSARRDKYHETKTWSNIGFRIVREIR